MFGIQGVEVAKVHEVSKWFHLCLDKFLIVFRCNEDFIVLFDQVSVIDWTGWGGFNEGRFDESLEEFLRRGNPNEAGFSDDFREFGFDDGLWGSEVNVGG